MARMDHDTQKIASAAMRCAKTGDLSELKVFPVELLRKAHYQLGVRDLGMGYREVIKDLIEELDSERKVADDRSNEDCVDIKPNIYGIGLNINAIMRKIFRFREKK